MSNYPSANRKFILSDAVILLAATAVGMVAVRENCFHLGPVLFRTPSGGWTVGALVGHIPRALEILFPLLVAWTPTLLLLRLRKPRPPVRRLVLQPGASACLTVTLALGVALTEIVFNLIAHVLTSGRRAFLWSPLFVERDRFWINLYAEIFTNQPRVVPTAIVAVWSVLAISALWSPEKSWIDRTGRLIGVAWLMVFVGGVVDDWLPAVMPSWYPNDGEGFQ